MDKATLQTHMNLVMLDSNALEVQLNSNVLDFQFKTLKNLLEERDVSAADVRRSSDMKRSASTNQYGTPDFNRIRELER
jgi:hypothetical protein